MTEPDDLAGRKLGEFVLLEALGEGGFGRVYRCKQDTLGREAVIKVLHHQLRIRDVHIRRFLREAQLASLLDHPYAAHIYAFGAEDDGLLWIAMEAVHGVTLRRWLQDRGPMPIEQFVPFFEHVAEVVQTAHQRGIVHRDLTPSNVMVIERAGRLLPKLLDFGVAKLLDDDLLPDSTPETLKRLRELVLGKRPDEVLALHKEFHVGLSTASGPLTTTGGATMTGGGRSRLTPDGASVGTPAYMAPEQWGGAVTAGPSADLYALAVVAFEALTGHRPFDDDSPADVAVLECFAKVPSLGEGFPVALDRVFQRALALRPGDRWSTALELAGVLRVASGIAASDADLPRIDADVRDAWLTGAPQPLAEAVAVLGSARNAHQAHAAARELVRSLLRYLIALALATRARLHGGQEDPALLELVRVLDRRELSVDERVRLLRLLVRPLANRHHPIPELVELVMPDLDGVDGLDPVLALHMASENAVTENAVRLQLIRVVPMLTQLLRKTRFVLAYVLVVRRDQVIERWTGRRHQPLARGSAPGGELVDDHAMLLDRTGRICADLWPLVQAVRSPDGADLELYLYDSHGHRGARVAWPAAVEHHDAIAQAWVVAHVIADIEAKLRMRAQIRVAARQWRDRGQPDGLLWRGDALAELERWARQTAGAASLGILDAAFVGASLRAGRRARWARRALVVLAMAALIGGVVYRASLQARVARQAAEIAQQQARMARQASDQGATQAEVEQGRQALLHDESAEAQLHLSEAYRRGDDSYGTRFMLARALQPRMAEQVRFTAVAGRMWSAVFSPDGRRIVTTDDRSAQVWDAETHRLLFTLPGVEVYQALYSADGTRLVTVAQSVVTIWDAAGGTPVHALRPRHAGDRSPDYYLGAISPDGRLVAAIDAMGALAYVWDVATGAPRIELRNDASEFPSIAFSGDGRWLATSGGDKVRVFETSTWAEAATIAGPGIHGLSFDPTGPRLATGSAAGDAAIWAIPGGRRLRHLREIGEPIERVAFSPDGKLVVTASRDGTEQIWNATSGALQSQGNQLNSKILSIEFDARSRLVVAAGASGAVAVADAALGTPVTVLEGPRNVVQVAHFDPSSRRVVGASWDGTARVWDAASPYRSWSASPASADCGLSASLEPDRRFVAVACRGQATRVWDTAQGRLLAELPGVTPVDDFALALPAVSEDGGRAAIARGDAVAIYELPGGRQIRAIVHGAPVSAVAFASTGHDLVSGATNGSMFVTRDDQDPIALSRAAGGIDAAELLPDGRVVAADARGRLRFHDPDSGAVLADLALPTRLGLLRSSPDNIHLVSIPSFTGEAAPPMLWDLERYRLVAQLEGHVGQVISARFVDGGDEILTTGGDGAARRWDAATGRLRQTYRGSSRFLADAALSPAGTMLVTGGADGLLRFWDMATGRPLWTLPAHRSHVVGIHFEGDDIITTGFGGEISRWSLPSPEPIIAACHVREDAIARGEPCAIVPR